MFKRLAEADKPEVETAPFQVKRESIWQQSFQVLLALATKAAGT